MQGIKTLNNIYHKKGLEFINKLLYSYTIINKSNTGSYFAFTYNDGKITFLKKNSEINKIDRILSKYYEKAIRKINSIKNKDFMNGKNYLYAFDYNPENEQPLTIVYILDYDNNKYYHDNKTLSEYADMLDVNRPPILFEGYLTLKQIKAIIDFLYIDKADNESFSKYILDVLGIKNVDSNSIIFRFYDNINTNAYVAKLINPHISSIKDNMNVKHSKPNNYMYLILIELINFIESYTIAELDKYVYKNNSFDENYILLINKIFKDFIQRKGDKYIDITFNIPTHLKSKDHDLNYDLIKDETVIKLLALNDNFKEIYKILLNFFRAERNATNEIFDNTTLMMFNSLVKKLNKILLTQNVFESYYPTYAEYGSKLSDINIKHFNDVDSDEKTEINLIIDNFDIINNSHIELAKTMYNKNNKKVIFVVLNDDTVFDESTRIELVNNCATSNNFIEMVYSSPNYDLKDILNYLKDTYVPILCATHEKYSNQYLQTIKNIKYLYNNDMKFLDVLLKDEPAVIESINDRDYATFKKLTPECTHPMFFKLDMIYSSVER